MIEGAVEAGWRPERFSHEAHRGLLRRAACLAMVTSLTGGDDVIPLMAAAAVSRQDVIKGKFLGSLAAVLATELIAEEDIAARQAALRPRAPDKVDQPDNGRNGEGRTRAMEIASAVLQGLGFATVDDDDRATNGADVKRLVVLVEY